MFVELIVGGLFMLAIGAMVGAMVDRPVAGALVTVLSGPVGLIIFVIWAKQSDKVQKTGLNSVKQDPDQIFRAKKPAL